MIHAMIAIPSTQQSPIYSLGYLLKKKYRMVLFLFFIISLPQSLYAEYVWPVDVSDITDIGNNEKKPQYIEISYTGEVYAVNTGTIVFVRKKTSDTVLPLQIVLLTQEQILVSYIYITATVSVGDKVISGEIIGLSHKNFLLGMYDKKLERSIVPFDILPNIDNKHMLIAIEQMNFIYHKSGETLPLSRRIMSDTADIHIVISVRERRSTLHTLPDKVWLDVGDVEFLVLREDSQNRQEGRMVVLDNNMVEVIIPDIDIPYGYFNITVKIQSPMRGEKRVRYNVFAYNPP